MSPASRNWVAHRTIGALFLLLLGVTLECFDHVRAASTAAQPMPKVTPCDKSLGSCWTPTIGTKWQWQISCDTPNTCANLAVKVPFYDIDWNDTPAAVVTSIHSAGNHAYCYISIGSWESWRPDANQFPSLVLGNTLSGWPNEKWLDVTRLDILGPIMGARMDVCKSKGFDGVQFDNVDGYLNDTGFPFTQQDDAYYAAWMANAAHAKGLSAAWENAIENTSAVQPYMEAAIFEECYRYQECSGVNPMTKAGKWVGGVEYKSAYKDLRFCSTYATNKIVGIFKRLSLDSYRKTCPGFYW